MVNSNLDKRINPSGQLFSNDTSCPFPISTASCTFTISSEIRPATLTKSAGWLHGSRGAMQVRRFSILSLSFASEVMRDGFSVSWLVTSLSPLWSGMFAISWTILLQVSVLYAHRFMVSGFRVTLWFRLVHFLTHEGCLYSDVRLQEKPSHEHDNRDPPPPTIRLLYTWRFFSMYFYITV